MKQQKTFFIEYTDTFGGEANYSWARRYIVTASTPRGALRKISPVYWRHDYANRYNSRSGAICFFVDEVDSDEAERIREQYSRVEEM